MANRGHFGPGHPGWHPFAKGENRHTRARAGRDVGEVVSVAWLALTADPAVKAALDQVDRTVRDPVERARRRLQELAPLLVQTVLAIATADPVKMAPWVGPLRVRLDAALQALTRAGLKDTVAVEHDFSDRFKTALSAFYGPPAGALDPAPAALPPDPGEPARRRRTPAARDRNQAQPGASPS